MKSSDIDHAVQSIKSFDVTDVGGSSFLSVSLQLERLAYALQSTEISLIVVHALRVHRSFSALVQNLVAIEIWRDRVLQPFDKTSALPAKLVDNRLRVAFVLHTETTLSHLVNAIMVDFAAEVDADALITLVDYCGRCMSVLVDPKSELVRHQKHNVSSANTIYDNAINYEFRACVMAATSLVRTLCENFPTLSLAAQSRIFCKHDFLLLLVDLIHEPPWTRKRENTWEKYTGTEWKPVEVQNLLALTPNEGHVWLSIFYLTCQQSAQARYGLTSQRKDSLLKLLPFVERLRDQLTVLDQVKIYLERLNEMTVPGETESPALEETDGILLKLTKDKNWAMVCSDQYEEIFSKISDANDELLHHWGLIHFSNPVFPTPKPQRRGQPDSDNVESIRLELECNDAAVQVAKLCLAEDKGREEDTSHGTFLRRKLEVIECPPQCLHPNAACGLTINFENRVQKQLRCANLKLAAPDLEMAVVGESLVVPESIPLREWRQLGLVEQGLVVQLGFRRQTVGTVANDGSPCCYQVDKGFISFNLQLAGSSET